MLYQTDEYPQFQRAPTLGGECYLSYRVGDVVYDLFQWAPTLGGECYDRAVSVMNDLLETLFQWAPTLGGEC